MPDGYLTQDFDDSVYGLYSLHVLLKFYDAFRSNGATLIRYS